MTVPAALSVVALGVLVVLGHFFPAYTNALALCAGLVSLTYYVTTHPRYQAARKARRWHAALLRDREIMRKADALLDYADTLTRRGRSEDYIDATIVSLAIGTGITSEHLRRAHNRRVGVVCGTSLGSGVVLP